MITDEERTNPPLAADEATLLAGYVEFLRHTIRIKTDGLDGAQLNQTLSPSTLTLGGMLKHLALVEDQWFTVIFRGQADHTPPFADVDWAADNDWDWHSAADDSPEYLRELWASFVERSREVTAQALATESGLDTLAEQANRNGDRVNLRYILLHMVEEYGRHAGHADLLRESIDGAVGE
jgi:uncharacterized damage-inducible protein DinB